MLVAAAAAILYGSLVDLQYYGYLPYVKGLAFSNTLTTRDFFYAVFVNIVAYFSTALLASVLAERLRRSETALRRREIDYVELENLNRAIVSSISSGLLSINAEGRIRLFNRAAESLTGRSFSEVYNADIRTVFPGILVFADGPQVVKRGEAVYLRPDGGQSVFGYASSRLVDVQGREAGLLVSFQDLTELKAMERRLARADRLAAIGQLASGMAHEIRNPLASISGSVQLLLEIKEFDDYQKRLMRIVVKEAERLSALLTDFLLFAKPRAPERSDVNLAALGDEIVAVAQGDARLSQVTMRINCACDATVSADRQQLRQALWNLIINSAEALSGGGTIWVGCETTQDCVCVCVEDDGPGIPREALPRIFDPFFSTKERGSGLGLATVHAIVAAHGGEIEVAERDGGGARFVLHFPRRQDFPELHNV